MGEMTKSGLFAAAALSMGAFSSGALAQNDGQLSPRDILESIETGRAAQSAGLPYGFELPDGAQITLSMLSGLAMQIEFDGSRKELTEHFASEFERLEYEIEEQDRKKGKTTFVGVDPAANEGKLVVSFTKASGRDNWPFTFLKIVE
jgi:hypothetical protein